MFVFLFVFVFRLNFETAGFEPHLPLLPMPLLSPRFLALDKEPRDKVPLFPPVDTNLIFCSVFFPQYGQYLFVVFGNFIASLFSTRALKKFKDKL